MYWHAPFSGHAYGVGLKTTCSKLTRDGGKYQFPSIESSSSRLRQNRVAEHSPHRSSCRFRRKTAGSPWPRHPSADDDAVHTADNEVAAPGISGCRERR
jgi:hypothetical protein